MLRALALVTLLAGCWTSPATGGGAAEPAASAPAPIVVPRRMFAAHERVRGPYVELAGKWTGHGVQYDNGSDWDIELAFSADNVAIGDEVGKVDYPGLGCGGVLIRRPERTDGTLVVLERITYGTRCIDGGTFQFPRAPTAGAFAWKWFAPDTGAEEAQGNVRRRE